MDFQCLFKAVKFNNNNNNSSNNNNNKIKGGKIKTNKRKQRHDAATSGLHCR